MRRMRCLTLSSKAPLSVCRLSPPSSARMIGAPISPARLLIGPGRFAAFRVLSEERELSAHGNEKAAPDAFDRTC